MKKDVLLSVRIPSALNSKLERLARATKRSKSWHVSSILANRVDEEAAYYAAIEEGLEALKRGDVLDHEEVERRFEQRVKSRKRRRAA